MQQPPLLIAVLLSGGGRLLRNLIQVIEAGALNARIALVISSRSQVGGVRIARDAGLPVEIIRVKDHPDVESFSRAIVAALEASGARLAVQAGWTCLWQIPEQWANRVMNIHPALLPKYGGKGFYGHHVHEAVLKAGETQSGCTIHFANNQYDSGPIIFQKTVPVLPDDTPDSLAARVFEQECLAYPIAIRLFAEGRLKVDGEFVNIQL